MLESWSWRKLTSAASDKRLDSLWYLESLQCRNSRASKTSNEIILDWRSGKLQDNLCCGKVYRFEMETQLHMRDVGDSILECRV